MVSFVLSQTPRPRDHNNNSTVYSTAKIAKNYGINSSSSIDSTNSKASRSLHIKSVIITVPGVVYAALLHNTINNTVVMHCHHNVIVQLRSTHYFCTYPGIIGVCALLLFVCLVLSRCSLGASAKRLTASTPTRCRGTETLMQKQPWRTMVRITVSRLINTNVLVGHTRSVHVYLYNDIMSTTQSVSVSARHQTPRNQDSVHGLKHVSSAVQQNSTLYTFCVCSEYVNCSAIRRRSVFVNKRWWCRVPLFFCFAFLNFNQTTHLFCTFVIIWFVLVSSLCATSFTFALSSQAKYGCCHPPIRLGSRRKGFEVVTFDRFFWNIRNIEASIDRCFIGD